MQPHLAREKVDPYRMVKGSGVRPTPSSVYPRTYGLPSAGSQKWNRPVQRTAKENYKIFTHAASNIPVNGFLTAASAEAAFEEIDLND